MKNNNRAIVTKIIKRTLGINSKRNFFITAAIALTAFMLTSVFSVGISFYETARMSSFRFEGSHSHLGFTYLTESQIEALHELDYLRHISKSHMVGTVEFPGFAQGISMFYVDQNNWTYFLTPAYTNIVGRYATGSNEIMLSRAKLSEMGIENPRIGMEIPLNISISGTDVFFYETFILSAFYTEFVSVRGRTFTPIFVSGAFAEKHGRIIPGEMIVNVIFQNHNQAYEYARRLIRDLALLGHQYGMHPAVIIGAGVNTTVMYVSMGIFIAFFMFTGFLLIYNVMYVSVAKDVRFYGLLKTLGTTPKQLKRIVNGQVAWLYLIGMPLGIALAGLASFVIVPAIAGDVATGAIVSFSPVIFVGGAAFTFVTSYLGAFTSARKAGRASPIEAIKFAGEISASGGKSKPYSPSKGKISTMAWRSVFRERKRVVLVLVSLFMGITVFTSIMAITSSLDIDGEVDYWFNHDFTFDFIFNDDFSEELVRRVESIDHVTEVHITTQTFARSSFHVWNVFGVDAGWIASAAPELDVDIEAFERGEVALWSQVWRGDLYFPVGSSVDAFLGEGAASIFVIGGEVDQVRPLYLPTQTWGGNSNLIISNTFLRKLGIELMTTYIGINVADGMDSHVRPELMAIFGPRRDVATRYDNRQMLVEGRFVMTVLGVALSSILALIGIFNFINVISVGLLVRKREIAALESIGMSKKQMRSMLRWEGATYWMLSVFASMTFGTGIAYGMFSLLNSSSPRQFPAFVFPLSPVLLAYALIIFVCTVTTELAYRSINKASLVERLREAE